MKLRQVLFEGRGPDGIGFTAGVLITLFFYALVTKPVSRFDTDVCLSVPYELGSKPACVVVRK